MRGVYQIDNSKYYLYTGTWPLYQFYATSTYVNDFSGHSSGCLGSINVYHTNGGVCPSISLKPKTVIIDGDGTYTSPYIIS